MERKQQLGIGLLAILVTAATAFLIVGAGGVFAQDGSDGEQQAFAVENYTVEANNTGEALAFNSSLADARASSDDPAVFEFSVTNTGNETLDLETGVFPPFSVLVAVPEGQDSQDTDVDTVLLGRNVYNGSIEYTDGNLVVPDAGRVTQIEPSETITRQYELQADEPNLTIGEYAIESTTGTTISYLPSGSDSSSERSVLNYTATFDVRGGENNSTLTDEPTTDEPTSPTMTDEPTSPTTTVEDGDDGTAEDGDDGKAKQPDDGGADGKAKQDDGMDGGGDGKAKQGGDGGDGQAGDGGGDGAAGGNGKAKMN